MSDSSLDQVERQLAAVRPGSGAAALRETVLSAMQRELRAARWDRRMARVAAGLLVVGIGLNAAIGLDSPANNGQQVAGARQHESLTLVAVSVAEATDARTGRLLARQMASRSGWPLSSEQAAVIDAAVERRLDRSPHNGREG